MTMEMMPGMAKPLSSLPIRSVPRGLAGICASLMRKGTFFLRLILIYMNHHADRNTVCTNRDERVQTNGRLSYKIKMGRKHTTTHGRMSRRLLPEFKPVYESVLGPPFQA